MQPEIWSFWPIWNCLSTASYAGIDGSGQGRAGLLETEGETALGEEQPNRTLWLVTNVQVG